MNNRFLFAWKFRMLKGRRPTFDRIHFCTIHFSEKSFLHMLPFILNIELLVDAWNTHIDIHPIPRAAGREDINFPLHPDCFSPPEIDLAGIKRRRSSSLSAGFAENRRPN